MKRKIIFVLCSSIITFFSYSQTNYLAGVNVTKFAGSTADPNAKDGQGKYAGFSAPYDIAVDAVGTMYVADYSGMIRKITPGGYVTTLAGSYTKGSNDGQGIQAHFDVPRGIAVDAAGNVYVSDSENHKIRKITPQGYVTTIAGSNTYGSQDGNGTWARFYKPAGLCVDANGIIYVVDCGNLLIRKIDLDGTVSTLAGFAKASGTSDGQGSNARFTYPFGITVDAEGIIYITDNGKIRKVTPTGLVSTIAGSNTSGSNDGQGTAASFAFPLGIEVDGAGNIYVSDTDNNIIRKITSTGSVTTFAGSSKGGSKDGTGTEASFFKPKGIAIDVSGNLYVADDYNKEIRKISPSAVVTTIAGDPVPQSVNGPINVACFYVLEDIVVDVLNNVYVTEMFSIRKISSDSIVTTLAGSNHSGPLDGQGSEALFNHPSGMAKDAMGNIYITDSEANMIRKLTPGGFVTTFAGSTTKGAADGQGTAASFYKPFRIALDGLDNIYVVDQGSNLIRKITPSGLVSTFAGSYVSGFQDGKGDKAEFNNPCGIAVDASNNVYVADKGNNRIRKITPNGYVSTIAGNGSFTSIDSQIGLFSTFSGPYGLVFDAQGNLYVSESSNRIRRITPNGIVNTVAGSIEGSADGDGSVATFSRPTGMAFDPSGNLFVADAANKLIRKITLPSLTTDIKDKNLISSMQLFPNPAKDVVTLILPIDIHGTLNVLDLQGRVILSQKVNEKEILSTAMLPNGMYVVNVLSDQMVYTQNLVILK